MKVAVIDLGTNTCNLLIAEVIGNKYEILHQSKQLVKLGDGKIKSGEISPEATYRVLESFQIHKKIINKYKAEKTKVIATSAIRDAINRKDFLETVEIETGLITNVISGEREAELIFKGVLLAFGGFDEPAVILDIGGGSNELIIIDQKEMIWKESRPTGMARVINQFKISDPVTLDEIHLLRIIFLKNIKPLSKLSKNIWLKTSSAVQVLLIPLPILLTR